ncbi:phage/plasmid replication protein [Gilliamella sp. Pas-s95]|uniref:phage/plasmid replication domain-containing protein n=1 Tax=Gilliamella sp. Pas-s95 TaxID=2687317 RepID=UPI001EEE5AA2|nr:phage/plasmid replication protein [Gilliamella sp. Pas-s95]
MKRVILVTAVISLFLALTTCDENRSVEYWNLHKEEKNEYLVKRLILKNKCSHSEYFHLSNPKNLEFYRHSKLLRKLNFYKWMYGQTFNFRKSQMQIHRARLRKIGIDIAQRCNLAKFSPVTVREIRKVEVADCQIPDWYKMPQIFKLVS